MTVSVAMREEEAALDTKALISKPPYHGRTPSRPIEDLLSAAAFVRLTI
jgi:hypothetical protein